MTHLSLGPSSVFSPLLGGEFLEDMGVLEMPAWEELALVAWEEAWPAWERAPALPAFLAGWRPALLVWGGLALTA